jgi:hypothetical protein
VATVVCKVGLFGVAVFIVVTLVPRTSAWSSASEAWAMHRCPDLLHDDLDVVLGAKDPRVLGCVGPATRAVCQVETTEWRSPAVCGGPKQLTIVKTAPIGPWDCTKRHVPTGSAGVLMSMAISGHKSGLSEGEFQELLGRVSRHDKRLIADRDWVASLLNARQRLVDAQEDVRR